MGDEQGSPLYGSIEARGPGQGVFELPQVRYWCRSGNVTESLELIATGATGVSVDFSVKDEFGEWPVAYRPVLLLSIPEAVAVLGAEDSPASGVLSREQIALFCDAMEAYLAVWSRWHAN